VEFSAPLISPEIEKLASFSSEDSFSEEDPQEKRKKINAKTVKYFMT
jgi:hypothetical protein